MRRTARKRQMSKRRRRKKNKRETPRRPGENDTKNDGIIGRGREIGGKVHCGSLG